MPKAKNELNTILIICEVFSSFNNYKTEGASLQLIWTLSQDFPTA